MNTQETYIKYAAMICLMATGFAAACNENYFSAAVAFSSAAYFASKSDGIIYRK